MGKSEHEFVLGILRKQAAQYQLEIEQAEKEVERVTRLRTETIENIKKAVAALLRKKQDVARAIIALEELK